jgi:hypothetical protein
MVLFFFEEREREEQRRRRRKNFWGSHRFFSIFFLLLSLSSCSSTSLVQKKKKKRNQNTMAYGRRYKAKLHVLEEDDLASILTPAPPCKVPGLGTKGKGEEERRFEKRGARFFV